MLELTNRSQLVVDDPMVSNKHLRIYTIIFDQGNPGAVAPLVYAQDLSLNGTFWNGSSVEKASGGVLLSDSDTLRISRRITFTFRCGNVKPPDPFDDLQLEEMAVLLSFPSKI